VSFFNGLVTENFTSSSVSSFFDLQLVWHKETKLMMMRILFIVIFYLNDTILPVFFCDEILNDQKRKLGFPAVRSLKLRVTGTSWDTDHI